MSLKCVCPGTLPRLAGEANFSLTIYEKVLNFYYYFNKFNINKREEHRKMQTIGPMNSVLFCSVRDNCVLKSILKSFNVIIGLDPIIYSHKKDRFARCCYGLLRAVFLRFLKITDVCSCLLPMFYRR